MILAPAVHAWPHPDGPPVRLDFATAPDGAEIKCTERQQNRSMGWGGGQSRDEPTTDASATF